jgi:GNAT superfamily N-acetyltransferase
MNITLDSQLKLVLNPIQSEDQPILYQLMDEVYRAGYRYIWVDEGDWYVNLIYNPHTVYKELKRSTSNYFFVEVDGVKIGVLKYDFPFSPKEIEIPRAMKLHRLYLHPDFHGKGIAQSLVSHCEMVAKENGLEGIWLEAMECQPQAMRFYVKVGFEKVLTYTLDFERIFPEYRQIQIMKKSLI